jgi:hypothetical protein
MALNPTLPFRKAERTKQRRRVVSIDDENYIREILAALPAGLSRRQFYERCRPDIDGGYIAEVQAAYWRYFGEKAP